MDKTITAVIIPCYNERDRLTIDKFISFGKEHPHLSFIFVDDGSTDGTGDLLRRYCSDQLQLLTLTRNSGKAEAVRPGIRNALKQGFSRMAFWDADLSTPLDAINLFTKVLDENTSLDMVIGSRINRLGAHIKRSAWRHLIGRFFMTMVNYFLIDFSVYDSQCGAKMMTAEAAREITDKPFVTKWLFDLEMLVRLKYFRQTDLSCRVYEYSLPDWSEIDHSKVRVFTVLRDLIRFFHYYRKYKKL